VAHKEAGQRVCLLGCRSAVGKPRVSIALRSPSTAVARPKLAGREKTAVIIAFVRYTFKNVGANSIADREEGDFYGTER
jgi:hypothetical protein